nr:tetratricopeptide repeat protein [Methylomonas sp. SURF-1]
MEQLKKWWEANQTSLIAGVVTALVLVAGWNMWQNHQTNQRSQASQMYQQMLESAAKDNSESTEKLAERLPTEFASTAYANYAHLQLAKVKVQKGDLEGAKAVLKQAIQTAASEPLKHVARLRLIQLMLATGQYEQGLQLIAEVDSAKAEGFSASYDELQGDLYVALDRIDEARSAYQSAIRTGQATPLTQFKLDDVAAPAVAPTAAN